MTEHEASNASVNVANPSYYRARYYDPNSGRFLSEDPINFRAGINFYSYVHNRPILSKDPKGKDPIVGTIVGLLGGAINGAVGSASTGGDALDIAMATIIGGTIGAGIGAIDPTPGIGTLMLIGGGSAFAGDLLGQVLHFDGKCHKIKPWQLPSVPLSRGLFRH